ncbi:MAG: GNAT family N-acetyltransferase [Pirellulales bacterium]
MSSLVVKPVVSRSEQKQFINFPWTHYAGDPNWIPPLLGEHKRLLGYKHHPFYDYAKIRTFLALRNGQVCGRVAAIVNPLHNERAGEKRGFFGYFECVDDQAVANALFDAARDWLFAQGMTSLRGPTNPSFNYECGLLVEGFHSPPCFMMTYNKPYYGNLVEAWGFQKAQNMFAFWGHVDMVSKLDRKLWFIGNEAKERFKVVTRPMNARNFQAEVEMFLRVYNSSMEGMWSFAPLSPGEIKELAKGLKYLIAPELALVAEIEGEPIGACLGLLDFNPRVKQIGGRLLPFGFLRLIRNKRAIKKMRVISINVIPEYQRWGLGVVLLGGLIEPMIKWGLQEVEFSWVLESNTLSRASLEKGGAKLDKTYRMYDCDPPA